MLLMLMCDKGDNIMSFLAGLFLVVVLGAPIVIGMTVKPN